MAIDSNTAVIPRPVPKPAATSQEVRARAVAEYVGKAQRAGITPDMPSIERAVDRELAICDAVKREARPVTRKAPKPRTERPDPIRREAEANNLKLRGGAKTKAPNLGAVTPEEMRHLKGVVESERWGKAIERCALIMQSDGIRSASVHGAIAETDHPDLTKELLSVWANYHINRYQESRHNRFAGLSEVDAARKFMRLIYDICDRSTGALGAWWVR